MERTPNIFLAITAIAIALVLGSYWLYVGDTIPKDNEELPQNSIRVDNCGMITPQILTVKEGDKVTFVNRDSSPHTIVVGGKEIILPPETMREQTAEFNDGAGTYAYNCDEFKNVAQLSVRAQEKELEEIPENGITVVRTFRAFYESLSEKEKGCIEKALSTNFDIAYEDEYEPTDEEVQAINACFNPSGVELE